MHLEIEAGACTGCRICEVFCSLHHEGSIWPDRSRIQILGKSDEGPFWPAVCHQCDDAPCAAACPVEAITIDSRTGAVLVDVEECIFCGDCACACPYGAVLLDEERELTLICDLCAGEPRCVPVCPKDVIRIMPSVGPGASSLQLLGAERLRR